MTRTKAFNPLLRLIVLLWMLSLACSNFSSPTITPTAVELPPSDTPKAVKIDTPVPAMMADDGSWVIFTETKAQESYVEVEFPEDFEGYWTPTPNDVLQMETHLGGFLQQNADQFFRHPTVWEQLDDYHRQYVGVIVGGKQLIYGNFFCGDIGLDWTQEWIIVMDGGDCFFTTLFEVESRTYIRLQVNGEA